MVTVLELSRKGREGPGSCTYSNSHILFFSILHIQKPTECSFKYMSVMHSCTVLSGHPNFQRQLLDITVTNSQAPKGTWNENQIAFGIFSPYKIQLFINY